MRSGVGGGGGGHVTALGELRYRPGEPHAGYDRSGLQWAAGLYGLAA